jgi:hypothetical protein
LKGAARVARQEERTHLALGINLDLRDERVDSRACLNHRRARLESPREVGDSLACPGPQAVGVDRLWRRRLVGHVGLERLAAALEIHQRGPQFANIGEVAVGKQRDRCLDPLVQIGQFFAAVRLCLRGRTATARYLHELLNGPLDPGLVGQEGGPQLFQHPAVKRRGLDVRRLADADPLRPVPTVGVVPDLTRAVLQHAAPEVVAAVLAPHEPGKEVPLRRTGQATGVAALGHLLVRLPEQVRRHDRLMDVLDDDPAVLGVARRLRHLLRNGRPVGGHLMDLPERATVPRQRPAIARVLEDRLHRHLVPAGVHRAFDAFGVERDEYRPEAQPLGAHVEDVAHDGNVLRVARDEPHDVGLHLLREFLLRVDEAQVATVGAELLATAIRERPDGLEHLPVGGHVLAVVAVGGAPAHRAVLHGHRRVLAANAVAREFHRVLAGLPRLHALEQFALIAVGNAFGGEMRLDARQTEAVDVVPGLVGAAAREPGHVVAEHRIKVAPVLRLMDEAGELVATPGAGAADGVIDEPPQDAVSVIASPALDRRFLVGKRPFLQIGRAPGIANREADVVGDHATSVAANRPRSTLLKRAVFPLAAISRMIAAYRVASGVLPLGLDHRPLALAASIISLARIGLSASASTFAAALMALRRFAAVCFGPAVAFALAKFRLVRAAPSARAALLDILRLVFFLAMFRSPNRGTAELPPGGHRRASWVAKFKSNRAHSDDVGQVGAARVRTGEMAIPSGLLASARKTGCLRKAG